MKTLIKMLIVALVLSSAGCVSTQTARPVQTENIFEPILKGKNTK